MRVWLLASIWIVYLKYCSSLTFLTINIHRIKLAFPADLGSAPDTSTLTSQARTKLWLQSGLQLPRSASSALCFADIRSSPFKAAVLLYGEPTSTLRQPAEPPPLHPWLTLFHCYIWHTARCRCAGEEDRFRCGSPSARHRSERFKRVFTNRLANRSDKTVSANVESTESLRVHMRFKLKKRFHLSVPGEINQRDEAFIHPHILLSVCSQRQFICESTCSLLTFWGCLWMLCSKYVITKLWKLHSSIFLTF